jgi:hypothetical protein
VDAGAKGLICTTNRLDDLDLASLRRFGRKVRFDFLAGEGSLLLYDRLLAPLGAAPLEGAARRALEQERDLAPGDFKVVRDRFALRPRGEARPEALVAALLEEARLKRARAGARPVGFAPAV